ncbi:DUF4396 domain-containing protein [Ramlibacter sp. PS4R-6]|uniref:DUF4396 domain-containing protein n=1 Tax=Ramlibacter sp. PS4R-6 TaxID=3133438 RepID=UPI00309B8483
MHHGHHHPDHGPGHGKHPSLNVTAFFATLHCLSGCAVGEVLGMVIGTGLGLGNAATVVLSVVLAFVFGYAFTMTPLLRAGIAAKRAATLAFAADTASISIMELVDNTVMLAIPGAMDAHLGSALFWGALGLSLVVAGAAAYPVNRWLIARGSGHAVVHAHHHH